MKEVLHEEMNAPLKEYQRPVLAAFTEIVLTQKAPDSKAWKPKKVIDELWELWGERPDVRSQYLRFHDDHSKRVSFVMRGKTRSYIQSGILFALLKKFVEKHAGPGVYVPAGHDARLIIETAEKMYWFCSSESETNQAHRFLYEAAQKFDLPVKFDVAVFFLTPFEGQHDLPPRGGPSEFGHSPHFLTNCCVGFYMPSDVNTYWRSYWPTVLFDRDFAYYELGFYIPLSDIMLLRLVNEVDVGPSTRKYLPIVEHVDKQKFRIFHQYHQYFIEEEGVRNIPQIPDQSQSLYDVRTDKRYFLTLSEQEAEYEFAHKMLKNLDV